MEQGYTAVMNTVWSYRIAIAYGFLFSVGALCTSFVSAFTGIDWSDLTGTQRSVVIAAMIANWTGVILAYLSKTMSRLEAGKPPIETGDTAHIVK